MKHRTLFPLFAITSWLWIVALLYANYCIDPFTTAALQMFVFFWGILLPVAVGGAYLIGRDLDKGQP
jgi:hypothetical protein